MSVWNICTASRMPRLCDLKAKIHLKTECKNAISLILVNQYSWTCATLTKARKSTETSLESTIRWRDLFSLLYGHALLLKKKKLLNYVPSGSSTVEDIIFYSIHVEFLTESSTEYHSVGLCYVGGMKWSMAENNGFCVY